MLDGRLQLSTHCSAAEATTTARPPERYGPTAAQHQQGGTLRCFLCTGAHQTRGRQHLRARSSAQLIARRNTVHLLGAAAHATATMSKRPREEFSRSCIAFDIDGVFTHNKKRSSVHSNQNQLGRDSINAGKLAAIVGGVLVLVFMWLSYGLFGIFANIALILNIILVMALLSILGATLTLPGIAGIVLTIGMAVDANVLVFERIKILLL